MGWILRVQTSYNSTTVQKHLTFHLRTEGNATYYPSRCYQEKKAFPSQDRDATPAGIVHESRIMRPTSLTPWPRPSRTLLLALTFISIFAGLLYTGFTLHNTAYEPTVVRQAVEAVQHAASEVQHEIIPEQALDQHTNATAPPLHYDYEDDDFCNKFPDPGNIAIIVKTGATELHAKLPTPLATTLKCVREPLIFSDLEQRLGEHRIHNALANFTPSAMEGNKDFDIYRLQQQYVADGREADLPELSSIPIASDDWRTEGKSAAWGLDKYKFLHMVEQTWDLAPNRDWYFFIEGDTYISWPNLLKWLNTLDPRQKLYYGNAVRIWEYPKELYFGHGGSGFLLSGAVVKEFGVDRRGLAKRWDKRVHKMWFGDYVLAAALFEELHLRLTDARPSLTSVDASALTFSEEVFCKPIVTLHHVNSQHLNDMFQFERTLNGSELLYRDVYHGSFPNGMPSNRTNWDNLDEEAQLALESTSEDSENESQEDPHRSYEDCEKACVDNEKCLQFLFVKSTTDQGDAEKVLKGECHIMHAIRLGQEHKPEVDTKGKGAGKQWVSGWLRDRIARWIEEHQSCSIGDISWP